MFNIMAKSHNEGVKVCGFLVVQSRWLILPSFPKESNKCTSRVLQNDLEVDGDFEVKECMCCS